jgi:flagella basal body P-ring formation protein FlgA
LSALRNELKASLDPSELALAELDIQIGDDDAAEIAGTTSLDWRIEGWSETLEMPHYLTFTKTRPKPTNRPIAVGCMIKLPPKALIVKNHIPAGHLLTPADVTIAYSRQAADEISLDQVVGMETKHALRPGTPIQLTDLRARPYVRTRDLVTVSARQGNIIVKRTMRALGTGGLGEAVELVTLDGKDRFTARVTGYHETEVLETQPGASR